MSDIDQPGQQSVRVPDWIPGWFSPRMQDGRTDASPREAVRFWEGQDGISFPIEFLRVGESVGRAEAPQRGITISFDRTSPFQLAVPPGYWVMRDQGGHLCISSHDEFRRRWHRQVDHPWRPAAQEPLPAFMGALRKLGEVPHTVDAEHLARELAAGRGWKGTPPAEGTRRRLILDTIERVLAGRVFDSESLTVCTELADEIESALLQSTIDEEAEARGAEVLTEGIEKVDPEASGQVWPKGSPEYRRVMMGRADKERESDAQEAIANVGEVLDAIDAPQAPTFAQRIQALYREMRERIDQARYLPAPVAEKPQESRAEGGVDLRPPDEWDIGQEARERLHERLTDGPIPNPAELARVIDILR